MQSSQRAILIVLIALLVLTGAGLFVTTEWGARTVSTAPAPSNTAQSAVDLGPFRSAQALSQLAAHAGRAGSGTRRAPEGRS